MERLRNPGFDKYLSPYAFSKSMAHLAWSTSINDLRSDIKKFLKKEWGDTPPVVHAAAFLKDFIGSSIWVSRATIRTLISLFDNPWFNEDEISTETHQYIIDRISSGKKIPLGTITMPQIYHALFKELCRAHVEGMNTTKLKIPRLECTIVLVPGVLNELYRNAAFERAARHLAKQYGISYFAPKINGRKSTEYNAQLLATQLQQYVRENPKKKLWLIGYSKGGIDCLHFIKNNPEFSEKKILGLSTIATPIIGSEIPDTHPLLRLIQRLDPLFNSHIYKKIDQGRDILGLQVQKSISQKRQATWFKRNHKLLSSKCFYSSLALSAPWHESHFWMVLAKIIFTDDTGNDGVVREQEARFPNYFSAFNLGTIRGHHLIGAQSSLFNQEALLEAQIILFSYLKKLK